MNHPIYHVRTVEIVEPYTLRVQFTDDTEQIIYLRPVLAGELYGPLLDPELFNRVAVDPEVKTLVWPNGADFVQPHCMIGPSTKTLSLFELESGNVYRLNGSLLRWPETH